MQTDDNALSYLRKESLDIYNRLHSIAEDITFVAQVHDAYPDAPLLPNLRCGAWYTNPQISADIPAYFKSTDGHFNNWSFNLRRPNVHLLDVMAKHQMMLLVDSTRSGKRIPDALSKTVPIWCAVINRALLIRYPYLKTNTPEGWDEGLYTPPVAVSQQEHHQIEQRLDGWAEALAASSFTLPQLSRPLRPLWITPATTTFPKLDHRHLAFLPVVCVSASRRVEQGIEGRSNGFSYVQGSGDDHELWGKGLIPATFWKHYSVLLGADRTELPEILDRVVNEDSASAKNGQVGRPSPITKADGRLLLCSVDDIPLAEDGLGRVSYLILTSLTDQQSTSSRRYIHVIPGKKGQTQFLTTVLPSSIDFIRDNLRRDRSICVACETGKDHSVGVVLAALQLFFDDNGSLRELGLTTADPCDTITNKQTIHARLEWIIASRPEANPSRSTLKRVNEFLLTPVLFPTPSYHGIAGVTADSLE